MYFRYTIFAKYFLKITYILDFAKLGNSPNIYLCPKKKHKPNNFVLKHKMQYYF